MSARRITAAGPGKLSATLSMRTPRRLLSEEVNRVVVFDNFLALNQYGSILDRTQQLSDTHHPKSNGKPT